LGPFKLQQLPDGRTLVTLHDAATHITGLPKKESALPEWQAAIEALMLVADLGGPDDVHANWHHAGAEPPRRERTQSRAQRASLGAEKAQEGRIVI